MSKNSGNKKKEIWKPFPTKDFSQKYEVSNMGNVRIRSTRKILKPCIRSGYKSNFYTCGEAKRAYKVHRIVAKLFVFNDDPENKKWVNHINGNKMDCRAINLEWCTPSYNNKHAIDNGLNIVTKKAVKKYDPETEEIEIFSSILDAHKKTGINDGSICNALSGKRKLAGGFEWSYIEKNPNNKDNIDLSKYKQVDGFPNYVINAKGKIYSLPYKRFLKYQNHNDGGKQIQLVNLGNKKDFLVHRLIGQYFLKKNKPKYNSIHHKDKNKHNNNIDNLEWCYVPGVEQLESKFNTPYYDPKTAIKAPKKKSAKSAPKNLLTANPRNLSKKQREERKKLLEKQKKSGSKTSKPKVSIRTL